MSRSDAARVSFEGRVESDWISEKIVQTIAEFSIAKYAKFAGLGAINHLPKIRSISHNRDFRVRRSS